MDLSSIATLYRKELRSAFRERSIVVNSILLPIVLYPAVLWLTFTGITFVQGLAEGFVSRVAVFDLPPAHGEVLDTLRGHGSVEVRDTFPSPERAEEAVRLGELDAVVVFSGAASEEDPVAATEGGRAPTSATEATGSPGARLALQNFRVRIAYDRSESRSARAEARIREILEAHRDRWIEGGARELGLSEGERTPFLLDRENLSTEEEMGAYLLAEMIPVFLVIMVALGCFVPAVDATAGERERGTWETTISLAASRSEIVVAKYLYVASLGTVAGVLNILAMTATVGAVLRPLLGGAGGGVEVEYPLLAVPVMVVGAVILALFFAAAMMILASFARSFKDGQSMVTPIYWLALVPLIVVQAPDQRLTPALALVPVANVALMIRDAIQGFFPWLLILESLGVGLALVAVCLVLARWILGFEDVLVGSYEGSFWRFVRERRAER